MADETEEQAREFALVKAFREGSIRRHFGLYIDSPSVTNQGLDETMAATRGLRELRPHGIRALELLLDDPDPGVRSGAAGQLLHEMPERVLPMLEALGKSAELEAGMTARVALAFYKYEKSLN